MAGSAPRRLLIALGGVALGGVFLWLALREVDARALRAALAGLAWADFVLPLALYWLGLAGRVLRWSLLLGPVQRVSRLRLAEVLLVGYAVNNALPARLGELFRADYAKRRCGVGRTAAFGSIIVERLLDLVAILGCFGLGLAATKAERMLDDLGVLELLVLNGGLVTLAAAVGIRFLVRRDPARLPLPAAVRPVLAELRRGMRGLTHGATSAIGLLTVAIWCCEVGALWAVFRALGVSLDPAAAMLVMGAASLSTLIPTAPGYLGTYQLVFVLSAGLLDLPAALGLVASTLIQVLLFGSVTVSGLLLYLARTVHNARMPRPCPSIER